MTLDLELLWNSRVSLVWGTWLTLQITFWAALLGIVLGLIVATGRLSKTFPFSTLAATHVTFFRGTPMLVQILLIYFGAWQLGIRAPAVVAGILALGLNSGAYQGEIFRAGIQSIEPGQTQAGLSLGLTPLQTFRHIVLPQAVIRVLPAIGNEFATLTKDSSLVSFIAAAELTYRSRIIAARTYQYITMYFGIALVYLILTLTISTLLMRLERRLRRW